MKFEEKPVYDFGNMVEAQRGYDRRFESYLRGKSYIEDVQRANRVEDKEGKDFLVKVHGIVFAIQLKTDFNAYWSGNLCFENVSQAYYERKRGVLGWGHKLDKVQWLVYVVAGPDIVHWFLAGELENWAISNHEKLKPFCTKNERYATLGVLMPIRLTAHNVHWATRVEVSLDKIQWMEDRLP